MRPPSCKPRGLSLIELVVSLTVLTLLVTGMASGLVLVVGAVPDAATAAVRNDALDVFLEDLEDAVHVTTRETDAITFVLPDRDRDGRPEVIRYAWSGTPGDPLTRQRDGGPPVTVLDGVNAFALAYETVTTEEPHAGAAADGSEIELSMHEAAGGSADFDITPADWPGQHIAPQLPLDTVTWRVTRAVISARISDAPDGATRVQLRTVEADGRPTATVVDEAVLSEATLTSEYQWHETRFDGAVRLPADETLCLVLAGAGPDASARLAWDAADGVGRIESRDAGATWTLDPASALLHYVYGRATVLGAPWTFVREHVTAVRVSLRWGVSPSAEIETSVQMHNRPEVVTAFWESDFGADPTRLDLDADDTPDWHVIDGPFDTRDLEDGAWWVRGELDTNPGFDFTTPTTVDVRVRDTSAGDGRGGVRLRVDHGGGAHAFIEAEVERIDGGTQTLAVRTYDVTSNWTTVHTETLPGGYVDLRLTVDPDAEVLGIRVDGHDRGSHRYGRISSVADRIVRLYGTDTASGVQFDQVSVRVGGVVR